MISDGSKDAGEEPCANTTIVLRSVHTGRGTVVGRRCAMGTQDALRSLSFWDGRLGWMGATRTVKRYDPKGHVTTQASLPVDAFDMQLFGDDVFVTYRQSGPTAVADRADVPNAIRRLQSLTWVPAVQPVHTYPWDDPAALR